MQLSRYAGAAPCLPCDDRGHSGERISRSGYLRHLIHGKATRLHEVGRQPCEGEEKAVIHAKATERGTPQRSLAKDGPKPRCLGRFPSATMGLLADLDTSPRQEPKQRQDTKQYEYGAPAEMRHQQAARNVPTAGPI